MRTVRRLRLRCFSFNIYSDVLSTLLLFALSKPNTAPSKALPDLHSPEYIISGSANTQMLLVELGGFEPPSRILFLYQVYYHCFAQYELTY